MKYLTQNKVKKCKKKLDICYRGAVLPLSRGPPKRAISTPGDQVLFYSFQPADDEN